MAIEWRRPPAARHLSWKHYMVLPPLDGCDYIYQDQEVAKGMPQFTSFPPEILTMTVHHHLQYVVSYLEVSLLGTTYDVLETMLVCKTWADITIDFLCEHRRDSEWRCRDLLDKNLLYCVMIQLLVLDDDEYGPEWDDLDQAFFSVVSNRFEEREKVEWQAKRIREKEQQKTINDASTSLETATQGQQAISTNNEIKPQADSTKTNPHS